VEDNSVDRHAIDRKYIDFLLARHRHFEVYFNVLFIVAMAMWIYILFR
jgi:hypothetical protein